MGGPGIWWSGEARRNASVCLGAEVAPFGAREVRGGAADVRDVVVPRVFASSGEHFQERSRGLLGRRLMTNFIKCRLTKIIMQEGGGRQVGVGPGVSLLSQVSLVGDPIVLVEAVIDEGHAWARIAGFAHALDHPRAEASWRGRRGRCCC